MRKTHQNIQETLLNVVLEIIEPFGVKYFVLMTDVSLLPIKGKSLCLCCTVYKFMSNLIALTIIT